MRKKFWTRFLLIPSILAVTTCLSTPIHAQVPVVDGVNILGTMSQITTIGNQITGISNTISKLENIIGIQGVISKALGSAGSGITDIGGNTIGNLISSVNKGMSVYNQAQSTYEQITNTIESLRNGPMNLTSDIAQANFVLDAVNNLPSNTIAGYNDTVSSLNATIGGTLSAPQEVNNIVNNFYVPPSTGSSLPSIASISAIQQHRAALQQTSSIGGVALASAALAGGRQNNLNEMTALSNAVAQSTDMRGDIKANSLIQLKILERVDAGNQLLSWLLKVDSSDSLAQMPTTSPLNINNASLTNGTITQ